jgi:hypothetical protein
MPRLEAQALDGTFNDLSRFRGVRAKQRGSDNNKSAEFNLVAHFNTKLRQIWDQSARTGLRPPILFSRARRNARSIFRGRRG